MASELSNNMPPELVNILAPKIPEAREPEAADRVVMHRSNSYASSEEAALLYDGKHPPLPDEPVPEREDSGWERRWDPASSAFFYFHATSGYSQWEIPTVPENEIKIETYFRNSGDSVSDAPAVAVQPAPKRVWGGYNPAIHGSWDPNAEYAKLAMEDQEAEEAAAAAAAPATAYNVGLPDYSTTAAFNRFSGKLQQAGMGPEVHSDAAKSFRQMNAYFDVDHSDNRPSGQSLKKDRKGYKFTKKEFQEFKQDQDAKKRQKKREWLKSEKNHFGGKDRKENGADSDLKK